MPAPTFRHLAATSVTALLVTGLAACGSSGSADTKADSTPSASMGSAATSPAPGSSSPTSASVAPGGSVPTDEMTDILKAGFDNVTTAHGKMSMDVSAQGQEVSIDADVDLQMKPTVAESMTMNMSGMQMQALLIDGAMYMKSPSMPTDKWVKITAKEFGSVSGGAMSSALTNPMGLFDQMSQYLTASKYVGTDRVNGAQAKHYTLTIDMAGAMKGMKLPSSSAAQLPKSVDEDVWIDSRSRPVKVKVQMGSMETMTMTLSDFGKRVSVKAPPASQVTSMSGLGGLSG